MAGGFSAGLAGLSAAYPGYVQGQSDQIDLADKKAGATALAASNFVAQLLGGSSLGMPSPQPPPPGQASQPAPQGPPPGAPSQGGPPSGPIPGGQPQGPPMGGAPPGFVNPGQVRGQPQNLTGPIIRPGGNGPMPGAGPMPQQGQPPGGPPPGAGARPPGGGGASPGGPINLQSLMGAYQQAARMHPELNQPGVFLKTMEKFAPLLQIADREQLMQVREQQLVQREQMLAQTLGLRSDALNEKIRHDQAEEGLRASGQKATEDYRKTKDELAQERLVNQDQTVKALGGTEAKLQQQESTITAFEQAERKNLTKLIELGEKKGNSNVPVVERWRSWLAGKGPKDADVNEFNLQYQLTAPGVARIISTANAQGVVSNRSREEFEKGFSQFQTQKSLKQSVDRIFADFDNRKGSLDRELADTRSQIDARKKALGGKNVPDRAPAPSQAPTGGGKDPSQTPQGLPPGWSFKVE